MIEIVFSGSAYGGLATASSSHSDFVKGDRKQYRYFCV